MSDNKPLVSVIIPTYKRPEMLGRAIESVLNQSYDAVECVVVDDNAIDSAAHLTTQEVVRAYPEVFYIKTDGKIGGGAARNLACQKAHGDYLTFLDDDDIYLPEKVAHQVSYMMDHTCDMSYTDVALYSVADQLVEYRRNDYVKQSSEDELLRQHILHHIGPSSVYMISAQAFQKIAGFGEVSMGQDWFFMLNCIEAHLICDYIPLCDIKQYLHDGERISTRKNKIEGENRLFEFKNRYAHLFNASELKYLKFRHFAVLAFASFRSHDYLSALRYAAITCATSPQFALSEAKRYFNNEGSHE